ncbi:hypothetical protein SEVIR_5G261801v4 [Setaria viridis]|nr:uncharacterized protein LOC117855197 isoform X1 [Setaria viridis]
MCPCPGLSSQHVAAFPARHCAGKRRLFPSVRAVHHRATLLNLLPPFTRHSQRPLPLETAKPAANLLWCDAVTPWPSVWPGFLQLFFSSRRSLLLPVMDRLQRHRHEEVTAGGAGARRGGGDGGAMSASRRGRFYHHDGHGGGGDGCGPAAATVPVVDQADCTAQTCRSCVAVTLADVIALGCCPCAVVSLLGLAFVKAPLAVARRCLRRLRRRHGELRHKKRVRDMDPAAKAKCRAGAGRGALEALELDAFAAAAKGVGGLETDARDEAATRAAQASNSSSGRLDAEKMWMEMYRVGHWGFGRLSISMTPPPPARPGCAAAARSADGGRKDADLWCDS